MITQIPWLQREWKFNIPAGYFPCLLERLRGTPARLEEIIYSHPLEVLTKKPENKWSALEHIGHLFDLCELDNQRVSDFLERKEVLSSADMENKKTLAANHNQASQEILMGEFRKGRRAIVNRLEMFTEEQASFVSTHPRLQTPMTIVDWMYFLAEHDDHHIAAMMNNITLFTSTKE